MSSVSNPFESEKVAIAYDRWFETPVGKQVAIEELRLFWEKMAPLGENVSLRIKDLKNLDHGSSESRFHMENGPPMNVLEVGSGTGWLLEKIYNSPFNFRAVVGIEPSSSMRKIAVKKFADVVTDLEKVKEKIHSGDKFVAIIPGDAKELPFDKEVFDRVVFFTSLEFIDDPDKAVEEALRVLKPGGRVVIVVLNGESPWMRQRIGKGVFSAGRFPTVEEFKDFLRRYGGNDVSGAVYWMPSKEDTLPKLLPLKVWWNRLWGLRNATALAGYIPKE